MSDTLMSKQTLNPGDKLISANGTFTLKFQTDGNLVLYVVSFSTFASGLIGATTQINRAVWNTFTQNKGHQCVLQADGNFVIYKAGGDTPQNALISTKTTDGDHLVVQDDGNVVLYSPSNTPVWQSRTSVGEAGGVNFNGPDLANPTTPGTGSEALHIGSTLKFGDQLRSANGTFVLKFQQDGNLVLFVDSTKNFPGPMNRAIWNSGTANKGHHCVLQADGNFVIYKAGGDTPENAVFSRIGTNASDLVVQDDGNVVAYNFIGPPFSVQWQIGTSVGQTPGANTNAPLPAGGV